MTTLYNTDSDTETEPVEVSPEAQRALQDKVREWTGWADATLVMGKPTVSPFAMCEHDIRTITANPETLVLNPHRVLLSLTPFRLRQEAVLTGALLHEAAHARHTHWRPRSAEEFAALRHSDTGLPVSKQSVDFAALMEEARIEGIMATEADGIGAAGLGWTMRAAAAHLVPTTSLSDFTDQQVMDLIKSWTLRAGRQVSLAARPGNSPTGRPRYRAPNWVGDFTSLLKQTIEAYLESKGGVGAASNTAKVTHLIVEMVCADSGWDKGMKMLDQSRDVLAILFPETEGEDAPEVGSICQSDEQDEQDSEPEEGEQDSEPEEGEQDGSGEDESDDEGEGEPEDGDESDEAGDGDADSEGEGEPGEGDADSEVEGEPDPSDNQSDLAKALAEMEARAKAQTEDETEDEAEQQPASGAGSGDSEFRAGGWRNPTSIEREVQRGAERFLRGVIAPTESSRVLLTEAPSATVDGAALAAWKAGGQVRDPMFFRRVKRETTPQPPVQIAVLADVSASMEELQAPTALLSWALASAAFDLRNFAGRGVQVSSTLIHWGSRAEVIQKNGEMMPGLKEFSCHQGTNAMHTAFALVEEQMPGFFDIPATPVNRLLVQFTDWELMGGAKEATAGVRRALEAGVNMLSIVPTSYSTDYSSLPRILKQCPIQRGASPMMKYNPMFPDQVWDEASRLLG